MNAFKSTSYERWSTRLGTALAVVVAAGAVAYANAPHSFNKGDTLQASDLNANFAALDERLTALEGQRKVALQTASVQAIATADTLDTGNYSVYVACPNDTRPVGGGCSLFQTSLSGNWEYNSQGRATGCLGALASTSRMCLRTGQENVGDLINDGNGSDLTISTLGWKCSMGSPPANTSLRAYVTCLQTQ